MDTWRRFSVCWNIQCNNKTKPRWSHSSITHPSSSLMHTLVSLCNSASLDVAYTHLGTMFHHPVDRQRFPDYYEIIKNPTDLRCCICLIVCSGEDALAHPTRLLSRLLSCVVLQHNIEAIAQASVHPRRRIQERNTLHVPGRVSTSWRHVRERRWHALSTCTRDVTTRWISVICAVLFHA